MASLNASTSSSKVTRGWTYDVFISFRGEDTRNHFVDHLYAALILKGIQTFKDDKMLGGGQPICEELVKAIQESRFAIIVFSKNYATSCWCLEEISKIMECRDQMGIKVLPVFYHVNPFDVRQQTGYFATAFETHENKFKGEMDKVNGWREALTAATNLCGQHIMPDYGGEAAFISQIVEQILADKQRDGGSTENHLIGIEPHIDALISLLKMEATEEVLIVGIWGMGGIGKTSIARALFKRIAHKFTGSSFVTDVRENSCTKKDICCLQQKILKDILGEHHGYKIEDRDQGAEIIQERCCRKKVLLVLDDVNDVKQLEFLAATPDKWFGPGSRIMITTRDQHLLSYANANDKYKPPILRTDQALELFSRHAFRKSRPPDGYVDLSNRAIEYTYRIPLALKVVGSFLCGMEESVWESALDRLAKTPSDEVLDTLKLSFDYLSVFEKQIFLDMACFYKGRDIDDVTRILDSFGFDPIMGITLLVEKSLIEISSNNTLDMHDLVQQLGWKVVQESAPNSRLWKLEKIYDLIGKNKNPPNSWLSHKMHQLIRKTTKKNWPELEVVEGIVLPQEEIYQGFGISPHVFESMKKLRILEVTSYFTCSKPTFLPDELRWFCWKYYPFSSLPVAHMSKLVGLEMEYGMIEYLWKGKKIMLQNLKFIHLKGCDSITRFPDVSGAPNIERLDFQECSNLVEVDESLGSLKKLIHLNMRGCYLLKSFPSILRMESLETLNLSYCGSLKRIPEFSPCMVNLSHVDFSLCEEIKELPTSIKYLSNLSYLNLSWCFSLKTIPNSICELKSLNTLCLSGCEKLQKMSDNFQIMESLKELHIDSINVPTLTKFCFLRKLFLRGEFGHNNFSENLHQFSSLEELHITDNSGLIQLPETIFHLSSLKHLQLDSCNGLQTIHGLPSGIQVLIVDHCQSLEKIEDLSKEYQCLYKIWILYCTKLIQDEENQRYLDKMLEQSFLEKWAAIDGCLTIQFPQSTIPSWFKEQHNGNQIALKLPPKWRTAIFGLAICCVSRRTMSMRPEIRLRFENDKMVVPKWEGNNFNEAVNGNMWTGYIPFNLFEQFHGGNANEFHGEDYWFHMTKGNLVLEILNHWGNVVRCGAKVVYKEDMTFIQQTLPCISTFYWSWKLTNEFTNSFTIAV